MSEYKTQKFTRNLQKMTKQFRVIIRTPSEHVSMAITRIKIKLKSGLNLKNDNTFDQILIHFLELNSKRNLQFLFIIMCSDGVRIYNSELFCPFL